jgi:hypothetical protein
MYWKNVPLDGSNDLDPGAEALIWNMPEKATDENDYAY